MTNTSSPASSQPDVDTQLDAANDTTDIAQINDGATDQQPSAEPQSVSMDEQADADSDHEAFSEATQLLDSDKIEGSGNGVAVAADPKIIISTPSPDIVIAEISDPESEQTSVTAGRDATSDHRTSNDSSVSTQSAVKTNQRNDRDQGASGKQVTDATPSDNSYNTEPSKNGEAQLPQNTVLNETDDHSQLDDSLPSNDTKLNQDTTAPSPTADDESIKDDQAANKDKVAAAKAKEEQSQEERESQLESYKQFVAQQENNREIDFPQVRVKIEANALPSKMYFLMNALSAIIASYGLVANSAAVVIGAMLVAMMLGPITGVALAIIDYRIPLLRKSLFTVAAGGILVIAVGFVVGLLHQGQPLTNEILSRTHPTSMDLMIALAGGTAGAYAMISPHLSVAVVGVAVATALVPPLAASGILFANGEMSLGFGAFLLAVTNIIAIQFTNAMVLWFTGFRRLVDDDYKSGTYLTFFRRNAVTLLLLVGLGIYLSINLNNIAKQQKFETDVKAAINDHFIDKGNVLTNTQFEKQDDYQTIRAVVRGETDPSPYDVQQIEAVITKDMEENFPDSLPVKLQLRYLPIQVIESNPLIQEKLDETDAAILTN